MPPAFYLDHGAYSAQGDLGATPTTFGVPQGGDGTATTASSAASVASFDVAGITADAGDAITIAGAVLTCVTSGAGANQFNAGTGATLATNIVSAINAATNTVSTSVARNLGNNANQLRNMVFARVTSSTVVEIMFRIGSAQLNHANNSAVAISQSGLSSAPSVTQFAGGSGGCFGLLTNVNAIGVSSSIAIANYGVLSCSPHVCANGSGVSTYAPTITDPIECRNNGKTITKSMTASQAHGRVLTAAYPLWLRVDDNAIWPGDNPSDVMTFRLSVDSTNSYSLNLNSTGGADFLMEARAPFGFRFSLGGSAAANSSLYFASTSGASGSYNSLFKNIEFYEDYSGATPAWDIWSNLSSGNTATGASVSTLFDECKFTQASARASASVKNSFAIGNASADGQHNVEFLDCTWSFNYTGAGDPAYGLLHGNSATSGRVSITINGGRVLSAVTGGWPLLSGTSWPPQTHITVNALKGVKLAAAIAQFQQAQAANVSPWPDAKTLAVTLPDATRTLRYENICGVSDWIPNAGYPYLGAILPDGTGWSLRVLWLATANLLRCGRPYTAPPIVKQYRAPDAGKIITLKFWCKDSLVFTDRSFRVAWLFVDSTGALQSTVTGGSAVVNTSDPWSNTGSYASPTYAGKSISLDTDTTQIKQGTEIIAIVSLMEAPSSASNENLFFDQELTLEAT